MKRAVKVMGLKRKRILVALLVASLTVAVPAGTASGLLRGLAGHWSGALVAALEAKGIVNGDELGRFEPDAPLTRAQLAKMLVMGLGFAEDAQLLSRYPSRFGDVPVWHWGTGYIESMAEIGLTQGYDDGTFRPNDVVTRAQLAVMLVRAAGLEEQARLVRSAITPYNDDRAVPSWARGEVALATMKGLITGFPDGTFQPEKPVTRAEGSTVLLRLLDLKGGAFHLTGTLLRFDVTESTGVLRDELGREQTFKMAFGAPYFRGGVPASAYALRPLDQVWVALGEDGLGRFIEARYQDLLVDRVQIEGSEAVVTLRGGGLKVFPLEVGTLTYLNARPVGVNALSGAGPAYLILDGGTGSVRVIDAIKAPIQGSFIGIDETGVRFVVTLSDDEEATYQLAPDAKLFLNGRPATLSQLNTDDQVILALNETGQVTYLQVER